MLKKADTSVKLRLTSHIVACVLVILLALPNAEITPVVRFFAAAVAIMTFSLGFWYNNSFTDEAILGDVLKEAVKSDNIEFEINKEIAIVEGEE